MAKPQRRAVKIARAEKKSLKIKVDHLADLQLAIAGKDKYAEVLRFEDPTVYGHVKGFCTTRSIGIDAATQTNGLPFGRLVEVYGAEQTGKTTLTDHVMAQTQALGGVCAVYDSEERKDKQYAQSLGVDVAKLLSIQPEHKTIEAAIETTRRALDYWIAEGLTAVPLCIVWDSLAGMPTVEEIENPTTKQPGVAAREVRRAMRQLMTKVARANALFLVTNQQYEKIGGFSPTPGAKKSTYGGGGIRYAATMRLEMIRTGPLKAGSPGPAVGIEGLCRIFKNSMAAPRDEAFHIEWGRGFQNAATILEKLKDHRYITPGATYNFAAQGHQPLSWKNGWRGLADLLATDPAAYKLMTDIYLGLPHGVPR